MSFFFGDAEESIFVSKLLCDRRFFGVVGMLCFGEQRLPSVVWREMGMLGWSDDSRIYK